VAAIQANGQIVNGMSAMGFLPALPGGIPGGGTRHHIIGRVVLVAFWNRVVAQGKFSAKLAPYAKKLVDLAFDGKFRAAMMNTPLAVGPPTKAQCDAEIDNVGSGVLNANAATYVNDLFLWVPPLWFIGPASANRRDDPTQQVPPTDFEIFSSPILGADLFGKFQTLYNDMVAYNGGADDKLGAIVTGLNEAVVKKVNADRSYDAGQWELKQNTYAIKQ